MIKNNLYEVQYILINVFVITLYSWGKQARWFSELRANINRVWKFMFLQVNYDSIAGNLFFNFVTNPFTHAQFKIK